jgi:hypothetical protein
MEFITFTTEGVIEVKHKKQIVNVVFDKENKEIVTVYGVNP